MALTDPNNIFRSNIDLVYYCYHKYISDVPSHFDDIIQEGMLGLWAASVRFDSSQGHRFTTFAVPYIVGYMRTYVRTKMNLIRIPRSDWSDESFDKYNVASLDIDVLDSDGRATLHDVVPSKPDCYDGLTLDLIDSFIKWEGSQLSSRRGPKRDISATLEIMQAYLQGAAFSEPPTQVELSARYAKSQAQVSRILTRCNSEFKRFLLDS